MAGETEAQTHPPISFGWLIGAQGEKQVKQQGGGDLHPLPYSEACRRKSCQEEATPASPALTPTPCPATLWLWLLVARVPKITMPVAISLIFSKNIIKNK